MRTFAALELPTCFAEETALLSCSIAQHVDGRFMRRASYHLTLAFLGDVDEVQLRHAMDALDAACAGRAPLTLSCSGLGTFGRKNDATLWLGVSASDALAELAAAVRDELEHRGVPFDRKKFVPHITLARRARIAPGALDGLPFPGAAYANKVTLFKSTLSPEGATYKPLYTIELEG